MAAWAPDPGGLATIAQLFGEYAQPGADQAQIYARLQQCSAVPDFNNYLAFLLALARDQPLEVRQSAGLLLKNNLRSAWPRLAPHVQAYVKACLLSCLALPERYLRITAGTAISTVAAAGSLGAWPELVAALTQALDSGVTDAADGALDALFKVCEEVPSQMDSSEVGPHARPAALLLPRLLSLFSSPHPQLQKHAIGCVNLLVGYMPAALIPELDRYVQSLVALALDPNPDIRRLVCQGLVALMQNVPERLHSSLPAVVGYMLERNQDGDSSVALEACEFWSAFCGAEQGDEFVAVLRQFMPQLVPVLLTNMAYEPDDEDVIEAEADELSGDKPDREQDLKPFMHSSKTALSGEGDEEEEGGDEDDGIRSWTLRQSSASSLDVLSISFPADLLPVLLPIVDARLRDGNWRLRESAILALGAVAEGCDAGLAHLAPQIIQGLLPVLDDARPLVRSISCWTLGRYSKWLVQGVQEGQTRVPGLTPQDAQTLLDALLAGLLKRVLDKNKQVQRAACGGLAALVEEAQVALAPRLEPIVQHLVFALGMYQRKSQRNLFEALGTLANCMGPVMAEPSIAALLLPPLLAKWQAHASDDREQLPVLECLVEVVPSLRAAVQPFAEAMFDRCVALLQQQMQLHQRAADGSPEYDTDLVVCALDAVGALTEALGASVESLAARVQLREFIFLACADAAPEVRQSGFALMGDLTKACPSHLLPLLHRCLELCCAALQHEQLSPDSIRACTNACWSIGELVMRAPADQTERLALPLLQVIAPLLSMRTSVSKGLLQNAAIALGRLALRCPQPLAPHVQSFAEPWCNALRRARDDVEKEHAFGGLCALVRLNPMAVLPAFVPLCSAFASWRMLRDEELHRSMSEILRGYQAHLPAEQWEAAWGLLEPAVREKVQTWFLQVPAQ